ncbi:hypothetical protein FOMG_19129 [Fusarium oxysporum f. sp. melonis 26406]|uniref:CCHC-type domain-containing protein n=1 Tax=Fusarium oxysporum f. sp. melonis 26406 TaxID=1089452 RepID=W9ZSR4_FUSOX|nr:hypothetical protein FOMG_19129 [Fusarium oxysporum f. sp. melonis 26406]
MTSEPAEACFFFVDDSNIWIEAQKFAASGNSHMPKLADSDRDPRLRIDIGKLINTLCDDRQQCSSFLYGSRPPPNDSVWEAFKKCKFQTKIYDRSRGKEKEVDHSMAADLAFHAAKLDDKPEKVNTTFVVITGDRDMLPPIKVVLGCGIRVELWAWKSGVSREFLKLSALEPLLSVKCLDDVFGRISFTNFRSTRHGNKVRPDVTIVLCEFVEQEVDNLEAYVSEQLLELCHLFYISRPQNGREMFVEFPKVKNIDPMFQRARELFKDMRVLSWQEYNSRSKEKVPIVVKTSNEYALLTDEHEQRSVHDAETDEGEPVENGPNSTGDEAETGGEHRKTGQSQGQADPDDNGGWQIVQRTNLDQKHRRTMRQTQRCPDHIRCAKRGDCGYRHIDEERNLFRDHPTLDFTRWKTRKCNIPSCRKGKRCRFAHTQNEAWCLRCTHEGHFSAECPFMK